MSGVEALDGFPIGHLFAVLGAVSDGREPNAEDVAAIEAWLEEHRCAHCAACEAAWEKREAGR